jgi:putative membrane protein
MLLLIVGIGAVALLLARIDWRESLRLVGSVGAGLLLVPASQLLIVVASTVAWRRLLPHTAPGIPTLYWLRLLADVVNQLLPAAQIGGDWVRAHGLVRRGVPAPFAYASVLVDMSIIMLTLVTMIVAGLLLAWLAGSATEVKSIVAGVAIFTAIAAAAVLAQRRGIVGVLVSLSARLLPVGLARDSGTFASAIDAALKSLYDDHRRVFANGAWQALAWLGGVLQTWMILRLLGVDAGLGDALIVEAVGQALRNAGGLIPGAVGAMEAGYVFGCSLAGLPEAAGLAVPLVRRLRDLSIGLPVLAVWRLRRTPDEQPAPARAGALPG